MRNLSGTNEAVSNLLNNESSITLIFLSAKQFYLEYPSGLEHDHGLTERQARGSI